MSEKIKVIYILGSGRSGSTLLDRLLGQSSHSFSVGELVQVWDKGFEKDMLCACQQPFSQCSFWQVVIAQLSREFPPEDFVRMAEWGRQTLSFRELRGIKVPDFYLKRTLALYQAIRDVSGASVIVDSSKSALYAYYLSLIPEIDLYAVHIVRDSRAVAYSLSRNKFLYTLNSQEVYMAKLKAWRSAIHWILHNLSVDVLGSLISINFWGRVRYEDLVQNPEFFINGIMSFSDAGTPKKFISDHIARLKIGHNIDGNPMRFNLGDVTIELDKEWMSKMSLLDRTIVTLLTAPLLIRYGYIWR